MRVLMNAGPWLPVPPDGYGGIENVVATLVPELRRRGVEVVLATVGTSTLDVDGRISVYQEPQFEQLLRPYNRAMGVAMAHMRRVVDEVRRDPSFDLVHDHLEVVGPAMLGSLGDACPPVLHTLHWDLTKHPQFYGEFGGHEHIHVNGVSAAQVATAPPALRARGVGHVHLATPLAERADRRPRPEKQDFAVILGRITLSKGQHLAARLARRSGIDVVLAGPVGPFRSPAALDRAVAADPEVGRNPDVRYFCDEVRPLLDGTRVRWVGSLPPHERDELVARARACLFPLQWEEPGGTAVVESLSLGTPVVGYARGCLPELVEQGRTGFVVPRDDEDALVEALRAAKALDPAACCREASIRFVPSVMAENYLALYRTLLDSDRRPLVTVSSGR
ncbi:glycosyltransferase [Amycolatopsis sp. YIM 10]|uniref:glycosyltransferase n=1 Tax=Amycolatopsis sp. YIM 10 TaxID=2653857 RepID=UPI00128FE2D8|nr:glycosyltransferase [Amycolatopsis sp. YIM 10]QFU87160.1 D-inositol-3-phosphate glycosyltransferase [Amycolatopsis sp. YIM 10]